jgi:hypothetical protein
LRASITATAILAILLLSSCALSEPPQAKATPTPRPTETVLPTTATWQPSPTSQPTPVPPFAFLPPASEVPVLSEQALSELLALRPSPDCALPCWNELTPGSSDTEDIAQFFSTLGVNPAVLDPRDTRIPGETGWFRTAGIAFTEETSTIGAISYSLGLDGVNVQWSAADGRVRSIWISYWGPPPQFDIRSVFSTMGMPDTVLMDYAGGGAYRTVLTYIAKGALVRVDARPREYGPPPNFYPHLCLSHDELEGPQIILVPAGRDPLLFTEWITDIPEYLGDQNEFTALSLEEYLHSLSVPNGCVMLKK